MLGDETVRTEEPVPPADKTNVDGLRDGVGPEGEMVAVRDRLPDNPLRLVNMMLELEAVPPGMIKEIGLAEIEKSITWTVIWTV